MSVQAMTWAMEQQEVLEPSARHVLLCLSNYAGKSGQAAFPSVSTLATDTGYSERTVQYRLRDLEASGLIVRGNQAIAAAYVDRHDRRPVVYDLDLKRGASPAPRHERDANEDATGCNESQNGVHLKTERGAAAAPNPSFNHPLPVHNPSGAAGWFADFWNAYPKKKQKKDALKAWTKIKLDADLFAKIMSAVACQAKSHGWLKDGGRFIPNAASWLNGERWEDEVEEGATGRARASNFNDLPSHSEADYQQGGKAW